MSLVCNLLTIQVVLNWLNIKYDYWEFFWQFMLRGKWYPMFYNMRLSTSSQCDRILNDWSIVYILSFTCITQSHFMTYGTLFKSLFMEEDDDNYVNLIGSIFFGELLTLFTYSEWFCFFSVASPLSRVHACKNLWKTNSLLPLTPGC